MTQRVKATIKGIVQGIGFRPFVYNLALKNKLNGYIVNTSDGVIIEVEGEQESISKFFNIISNNHLPLVHITSIERIYLEPIEYQQFEIRKSISNHTRSTLISPDICVCDNCLREMNDPTDRRYRYPFINCTNCGPRYTIIRNIPYDRPFTSMHNFEMCEKCLAEYKNPANRRFHAQPNACPTCGPHVELWDARQAKIETDDPINTARELLKRGNVLAIKGLGGFQLAVDAKNNKAVLKLRERKKREEKPIAVMVANVEKAAVFALMEIEEQRLLESSQRPIVLLKKIMPNPLAFQIAPNNKYIGVMLPYTPLHYLFLNTDFLALVMTSGNISEEPIAIDNEEAFRKLANIADYFLIHNRDIYLRSDDSVTRYMAEEIRIVRRSRGYVPAPIFLRIDSPKILALGAEIRNTICLTKGNHAFLSQHIGNLKNQESYDFFKMTARHLKQILDIKPEIVAYDLHPNYLSTQYALEQQEDDKIGVQHHHAHIASCMAEHGLDEPVIGLSFDGAGFGTDGNIWGSEILLVSGAKFKRLAHLDYVPMPGGNAAIKEPWRMAISYLEKTFFADWEIFDLPGIRRIEHDKKKNIQQMLKKNINCPLTSSLGCLFDAVAALLDVCSDVTFESQAAISLEMIQRDYVDIQQYNYSWEKVDDIYVVSPFPLIREIVYDTLYGQRKETMSRKFHQTLIRLYADLTTNLSRETGIKKVVLSGCIFQNNSLLTGLQRLLESCRLRVYSNSRIPTNDGGIALGQAYVAAKSANE